MIAVAAILKIYFEILLLYPKGELTQNVIKSRGHLRIKKLKSFR